MALGEKAVNWWKGVDKKNLAILLLIFILGFAVRAHLMKYDLMFGFDSYFHARITSYVIEDFAVPEFDPTGYYQEGGAPLPTNVAFFWYFCAILYKIFTLGAPYNKELWIFFVKLLPALFGAAISAGMYLLGKEAYSKNAGIAMGFFAAVVPAFVYRTMSGFLEEDALGFLWMVLGFYFLIKVVKNPEWNKEKVMYAVASGVLFGLMAMTWRLFLLVPLVLFFYFIITAVIMPLRKIDKKIIFNFTKLFAIAFILFAVIATVNDGTGWVDQSYKYVANYAPISPENVDRIGTKTGGVIKQTVGEENLGNLFFANKYNILIIFALAGFFLFPYHMFRNKKDYYSLIFFFWLLFTFVMAWSKLKFTYTLGLPIAASAGIVFHEAFNFMKNRTGFEKKFLGLALGFMVFCGIGIGSFFVMEQVPTINQEPKWVEAMEWVTDNTPANAKLFNWWDYGHWMAFLTERGTSNDNRNYKNPVWNAHTAQFFIVETEAEAMELFNAYGSDYLIFDTGILTRLNSMAIYAYQTVDSRDPRISRYYGNMVKCQQSIEPLTGEVYFQCGGDVFKEKEISAIPTTWSNQPLQLMDGRTPLFIYREEDYSAIYVFNAAVNKTYLAKLVFNDPSVTSFEKVFDNKKVKIYRAV